MAEWIDVECEWAYWINPRTFRMPRVRERVPLGVVVLIKEREVTEDGRKVVAASFFQSAAGGLEAYEGKKEASAHLARQMLLFMREKKMWPPGTDIRKVFQNGNVDLTYAPGDYDTFVLRLTPELVGGEVEPFLKGLAELDEAALKPAGNRLPWRVEPAKSGRSRCRECGEKIAKGELRLGKPSEFEGHVSYAWHHLDCSVDKLPGDAESLVGFDDLDDEQQDLVRSALVF